MSEKSVAEEVTAVIEKALARNVKHEAAIIIGCLLLFGVGLYLLYRGATNNQLASALSGGLCELAIGWPIKSLVKLRKENIRLATLPSIIRMADSEGKKELVYKMVDKLIDGL